MALASILLNLSGRKIYRQAACTAVPPVYGVLGVVALYRDAS